DDVAIRPDADVGCALLDPDSNGIAFRIHSNFWSQGGIRACLDCGCDAPSSAENVSIRPDAPGDSRGGPLHPNGYRVALGVDRNPWIASLSRARAYRSRVFPADNRAVSCCPDTPRTSVPLCPYGHPVTST